MTSETLARGWRSPVLPGLAGLLRGELSRWLGRRGLVHLVVWTVVIQGLLLNDVLGESNVMRDWRGFDALNHLWWIATPLAAIAIAQNALPEERRNDTAQWVLSKPVSRSAFVTSKVLGDSAGLIALGVVLQGFLAYLWMPRVEPTAGLPIAEPAMDRLVVTMAVFSLVIVFVVALTIFVTTLLPWRGPAAAVGLVVWVLLWIAPWELDRYTIGGLVTGEIGGVAGRSMKPLAAYLVLGNPLEPMSAIVWTAVAAAIFTALGSFIFRREQF